MKDRIFAVGYRRLPADRVRRWAPWPIARTALALAWRKRSTKLGAAVCFSSVLIHGLVLATQVLAQRMVGSAGADPVASLVQGIIGSVHSTLSTFISVQTMACSFLLAMVGAGLVAEDRRTGALELYFSRPLRRRDYVVGKLLAAGLVPAAALLVPFWLLWLLAVGIAPPTVGASLWRLLLPGLAGVGIASVLLTTTILGLSALGERGRTVGVIYVVAMVVLSSLGDGLPQAGHRWAGYLSPLRNVQTLADTALHATGGGLIEWVFSRPATNPSVLVSALCLVALSALGLGLLLWRVRREVAG